MLHSVTYIKTHLHVLSSIKIFLSVVAVLVCHVAYDNILYFNGE